VAGWYLGRDCVERRVDGILAFGYCSIGGCGCDSSLALLMSRVKLGVEVVVYLSVGRS
jgi:hypothetical protein